MKERTRWTLGMGNNTRFWHDLWIGDELLKINFPRLFSTSSQQDEYIANMGGWKGMFKAQAMKIRQS